MNNYIDISKQQRVVFVDNIPYNSAKKLSERYPFAIIMTDSNKNQDYSETGGHHTIWRAGKCYSYISAVDNTPITIDTYSISLNISPTGKLSLNVGSAITNYILFKYLKDGIENKPQYEEIPDGNYESTDDNKQYTEIIHVKNIGELYFNLFGINNEPLNEYNENGLDLFDFRLFKLNDENNDILSTYISNLQSQKEVNLSGIKYIFNVIKEYTGNDLILEVSYKLLGKTKIKRYPIKLYKTLEDQFYWIGSGNPILNNQVPNEITNAYLEENPNWHILEDDIKSYNDEPLEIPDGNIHVIIPSNKNLRVAMQPSGSTNYIVDEGTPDYSYEILDDNIQINNTQYKLLKLYNTDIKEFTNIIQ